MGEHATYPPTRVWNQYCGVIAANLVVFGYGAIIGWVSPALAKLSSEDTPLLSGPLTSVQVSWIGSINCIGACIGAIFFGYVSFHIGSKRTILFLAFPIASFWLLIYFATNFYYIYVARFIAGMAAGTMQSTVLLYTSEIANDDIRGRLGSFTLFLRNMGTLMGFVLGSNVEYEYIPCICIVIPIASVAIFTFLPNTPRFYLQKGQMKNAKDALRYYKGSKDKNDQEERVLDQELEKLSSTANERGSKEKLHYSDILNRAALKGLGIGISLSIFTQITAGFTIISYAVMIFQKAHGTSFDPYTSSIVLGVVLIFGSLATATLADILGRRKLNIISLMGSAIGLLALCLHHYLYLAGYDLSAFTWVPVVSLSFVTFISTAGIIPLSYICSVEYLPLKIRTLGMSIVAFTNSGASFLSVKMFPILLEKLDLHGCMMIYGFGCVGATIFVLFFLKETSGQSLDDAGENEIIEIKSSRSNNISKI